MLQDVRQLAPLQPLALKPDPFSSIPVVSSFSLVSTDTDIDSGHGRHHSPPLVSTSSAASATTFSVHPPPPLTPGDGPTAAPQRASFRKAMRPQRPVMEGDGLVAITGRGGAHYSPNGGSTRSSTHSNASDANGVNTAPHQQPGLQSAIDPMGKRVFSFRPAFASEPLPAAVTALHGSGKLLPKELPSPTHQSIQCPGLLSAMEPDTELPAGSSAAGGGNGSSSPPASFQALHIAGENLAHNEDSGLSGGDTSDGQRTVPVSSGAGAPPISPSFPSSAPMRGGCGSVMAAVKALGEESRAERRDLRARVRALERLAARQQLQVSKLAAALTASSATSLPAAMVATGEKALPRDVSGLASPEGEYDDEGDGSGSRYNGRASRAAPACDARRHGEKVLAEGPDTPRLRAGVGKGHRGSSSSASASGSGSGALATQANSILTSMDDVETTTEAAGVRGSGEPHRRRGGSSPQRTDGQRSLALSGGSPQPRKRSAQKRLPRSVRGPPDDQSLANSPHDEGGDGGGGGVWAASGHDGRPRCRRRSSHSDDEEEDDGDDGDHAPNISCFQSYQVREESVSTITNASCDYADEEDVEDRAGVVRRIQGMIAVSTGPGSSPSPSSPSAAAGADTTTPSGAHGNSPNCRNNKDHSQQQQAGLSRPVPPEDWGLATPCGPTPSPHHRHHHHHHPQQQYRPAAMFGQRSPPSAPSLMSTTRAPANFAAAVATPAWGLCAAGGDGDGDGGGDSGPLDPPTAESSLLSPTVRVGEAKAAVMSDKEKTGGDANTDAASPCATAGTRVKASNRSPSPSPTTTTTRGHSRSHGRQLSPAPAQQAPRLAALVAPALPQQRGSLTRREVSILARSGATAARAAATSTEPPPPVAVGVVGPSRVALRSLLVNASLNGSREQQRLEELKGARPQQRSILIASAGQSRRGTTTTISTTLDHKGKTSASKRRSASATRGTGDAHAMSAIHTSFAPAFSFADEDGGGGSDTVARGNGDAGEKRQGGRYKSEVNLRSLQLRQ